MRLKFHTRHLVFRREIRPALPGQPGSWLLFLVSPRKSNQKEGDPGSPTSPAFLSQTGRCATRAARSDSARLISSVLASSLGASQGVKFKTTGNYFGSVVTLILPTRIVLEALKFHSRHLAFRRKNATPVPLKFFSPPQSLEYPLRAATCGTRRSCRARTECCSVNREETFL